MLIARRSPLAAGWARRLFLHGLRDVTDGRLTVVTPDGAEHHFGAPDAALHATLVVHADRFFARALAAGDIGLGESYMDGDWSTPGLVPLVRLMLRNLQVVDESGGLARAAHRTAAAFARRLRDNTVDGSRDHVRRHYDLGNDFFALFLDAHLVYSCARFASERDSLEQAQERKLDDICRRLTLGPSDHLLEIGTGWGALAVWAARHYGCRVTTTTVSREQFEYARAWAARLGEVGARIDVRCDDYRHLTGRYDKIVSIEMFEAVGLGHYDDYFAAVDRLLAPDGAMLLQTITVTDQWFPRYVRQPDWIEKYIFPGGQLASVGAILASLARRTTLSLHHAENIGMHYARTLHEWRDRFHRRLGDVRALGFDERFIRMWDLYLGYCEAAFLERHAGDFQLLLAKNGTRAVLFNERPSADTRRVAALV